MRPQRLYKTNDGKYYFLIDGLRKYIRIPKNLTEAELVKLNMKTILKLFGKKMKRRKKRKEIPKLENPIVNGPFGRSLSIGSVWNQPTASSNFVQQEKPITQISELVKQDKRRAEAARGFESLIERAGKNLNDLFKGETISNNPQTIKKPLFADTTEDEVKFTGQKSIDEMLKERLAKSKETGDLVDFSGPSPTKDSAMKASEFGTTSGASLKSISFEDSKTEDFQQESKTGPEAPLPADAPRPKPPPNKPVYTKPSRAQMQDYLKKGDSGVMPSLKEKPKTTEQKLAETPSFSSTTKGTESPGASPMPVSVHETTKNEFLKRAGLEPDRTGAGYNPDDGLFNDEIAKIIRKRVGRIISVIPSDKVNDLLSYVVKGDKQFAAVVNTNPSYSDGSGNDGYFRPGHWRAIFINNMDDFPSAEYFDPLAEGPPPKQLVAVMKKLCKKMNPESLFLYKQNMIRRQAKEKSTCGWHALQFIDDRWNGVPWSEATGYDHYISQLSQPADDSQDGEKEVNKYIKKYKIYL